MSNEAAGLWPTWDELFGSPPGTPPGDGTPPPFTPPTRDDMPDYLLDRLRGNSAGSGKGGYGSITGQPDDALGWNLGGDFRKDPFTGKERTPPDPSLIGYEGSVLAPIRPEDRIPADWVVNPWWDYLGEKPYISKEEYERRMSYSAYRSGGGGYDAYDATLQTYGDPAKLGYDPGAPWQRENDYYAALKARSDLSRATAGNYQEIGMEYVDGVGYVPWTEYVTGKYGTVSAQEFKNGPDAFNISGLPQGVDTRVGNYYQPDGSIAYQSPVRPPALMPTNIRTPEGNVQGYEAADFFIGGVPKEFRQGGSMGPVQWVLSNDVSRSQPRANAFGDRGFAGAPGGVVSPGSNKSDLRATDLDPTTTSAYDYLRGVSPSQIKLTDDTTTTDPNPFRGKPGTTTAFTAEDGDTPQTYPGVSFYEATPDGGLKKVTSLIPGKDYFAVRENYDYTGFPLNPTMYKGGAGDAFTVRMGDGGDVSIDSVDQEFSVTSVTYIDPFTGKRVKASGQDIRDGKYGEPGVIPAGATVVLTKKASQWETPADNPRTDAVYDDAAGTYIDPNNGRMWLNDGTPGGTWVEPDDYAAAKKKEPYWDERYQAYVDPASNKVWRNAQEGWVPKPPIANDNLEQPPADDKGKPVETPKPEPLPPQIDEWIYSINAMKDNPYERKKSYYEIPVPSTLLGTSSDDWPLYVDIVELTTTSDGKPTIRIVGAGETLQAGKSYVIRVTKSDLIYVAANPPKGKK